MIKIKIFYGAAGTFNVWAYVTRLGCLYRIDTQNECPELNGFYYLTINRTFVSA